MEEETYTPCDPGCPGWLPHNDNFGDIVRCDECARFENDDEAAKHADKLLWKAFHADRPDRQEP